MSGRGDSVMAMKAIYITEFGGPEVMKYVDLPEPVPAGSQIGRASCRERV